MNPDDLTAQLVAAHNAGDDVAAAKIVAQMQAHPEFTQVAQAAPQQSNVGTIDRNADVDTGPGDMSPQVAPIDRDAAEVGTSGTAAPDGTGNSWLDSTNAVLQPFARNVTMGLAPKAEAYIASKVYGVPYQEAVDAQERNYNATAAQHPILNAIGNVAGFVEGARALPTIPGLGPVAGQAARNFGRAAVTGSAYGAGTSLVDSLGRDQTTDQRVNNALVSAGIGGIGGPLIGELGAGAAKLAGPYVRAGLEAVTGGEGAPNLTKGWRYLAGKLGITPDQMAGQLAANRAAGVPTTVQSVLQARDAGALRGFAEKNPEAAQILQGGQRQVQEAAPADMATAIEQNIPTARPQFLQPVANHEQNAFSLSNSLDDSMDATMAPIRATQATLPQTLVENPLLTRVAPRIGDVDPQTGNVGVPLRDKLQQAAAAAAPNGPPVTDPITFGDLEKARRQLRGMQGGSGPDAIEAGHTADALEHVLGQQSPEYTAALQHYGRAAKYIQGFQHGNAGQPISVAQEASLRAALRTPEGQQGHAAGTYVNARDTALEGGRTAEQIAQQLSRNTAKNTALQAANPGGAAAVQDVAGRVAARAEAAARSTPGGITVPDEGGVGNLAQAAGNIGIGASITGLHKISSALGDFFSTKTFPADVQRTIATQLTSNDPAAQAQAIASLRRAGADNQTLRRLVSSISGAASIFGNEQFDQRGSQ